MGEINWDKTLQKIKNTIVELQEEPEFYRTREKVPYNVDEYGSPTVKLAIGNVPLDYDLWDGLRNPAAIGMFPAGLREIWDFYASRRKERVDEYGRQTIFQTPRSFEYARSKYKRAVLFSVMLPCSNKILRAYDDQMALKGEGSSHMYARMFGELNHMLDMAVGRVAIDLVTADNAVVGMDEATTKNLANEAIPLTHQGGNNGPYKASYPQKSIAALVGLGQLMVFGVVCRDELVKGKVERFIGPIRSIVLFDNDDLVTDGKAGVMYPTPAWRAFLLQLYDFTNVDSEINRFRFCTYIPQNDGGCGKCVEACRFGAIKNSVPTPTGKYTHEVAKQTHRFYNGKLQFDGARCLEERGQMRTLFSEWSCSRCVSTCAVYGNKRVFAAQHFYPKMRQLTESS